MWSPWKSVWHFFWYNTFCRYSVSRKSKCFSLAPKLWLFQRSRYEIILFFSKMTVLRASYWILLCNCLLPTVFLMCEAGGSPSRNFFDVIHFLDTQFRENLNMFPSHQNYGFCRVREMKSFYFSPKWRSSRLPIEFFSVTACFQRSSYCAKTVEVCLAFCFNIKHFVDTQFRENLSVFPLHQNYGFCSDRQNEIISFFSKMTVFRASYWMLLCNCGLPTVFLLCEACGSPCGIFFI